MKKATILFSLLLSMLVSMNACKKCDNNAAPDVLPVTVVRNCTGVYLGYEGKEYKVCNGEAINGFADGAGAKAAFTQIENCTNQKPEVVCMMAYPYEALIQVSHIE